MDAGATVAAMNVIQWALDNHTMPASLPKNAISSVGHDILVSTLGHLRRSLREYLTRGGK